MNTGVAGAPAAQLPHVSLFLIFRRLLTVETTDAAKDCTGGIAAESSTFSLCTFGGSAAAGF